MKLLLFIFSYLCFLLFEEMSGQTDEGSSSGIQPDLSTPTYEHQLETLFHDYNVFENGTTRRWEELPGAQASFDLSQWKNFCIEMSQRVGNQKIIECDYEAYVGGSLGLHIELDILRPHFWYSTDLLKCRCWEKKRKTKTKKGFYVTKYKDDQYFKVDHKEGNKKGYLSIIDIVTVNFNNCAE